MDTLCAQDVDLASLSLHEHAKFIRAALFSFGKNLLSVDDSTVDLPLRQLKVCHALYVSKRSMSEIGREVGLSASAVTQVVDGLESRGLIERTSLNEDRRTRIIQLTAKGRQLMRLHEEAQLARIAAVLTSLSDKERRQVIKGMQIFSRSCESRNTLASCEE